MQNCLRASTGGGDKPHVLTLPPTGGPGVAYAFAENTRAEVRLEGGDGQRTGALCAGGGKAGQGVPCIAVRADLSGAQCADAGGLTSAMEGMNPTAVAVQASQSGVRFNETVGTLDANYGSRRHNGVMQGMQVRRLTPVECERLQGFPDGYTAIPWRKKPASECPDSPRYKALGNSWAVPVVRWIGSRILKELSNA